MPEQNTSWVVVTGGVISTLGKGVVSSSIGLLLKSRGYAVDMVKIDPYINVDAGTMRPTEHGEVFVTFDGGETDQDIGNYERFLNQKISKNNNITTGQVFKQVIQNERDLKYDGKCVQLMHHIPKEIERRLRKVSKEKDVVVVEIGGTVGDYENIPFLETLRRMKMQGCDVQFVHVSYLPVPPTAGEMKTKPTQHSVKELNRQGISANYIIGRSKKPLDNPRKEKISLFCNVPKQNVISCPDLKSIYDVPLLFKKEGFDKKLIENSNMEYKPFTSLLDAWVETKNKVLKGNVKIGIVGKYFETGDFNLEDSYISVIEAIKHAATKAGVSADIQWLSSLAYEEDERRLEELSDFDGVIVPGGFGKSGVDGKIEAIRYVRENNIPFLGLCYGLQLAVVEHARNKLGLDAHTTEIDEKTSHPVISLLPEQIKKMKESDYGASMRLGEQEAYLKKGTKTFDAYGKRVVFERHRHRYEVNPIYADELESDGLVVSGYHPEKKLVEFIERDDCDFFLATQAHPEFTSSPLRPNPMFVSFIDAAKK